MKNSGDSPPSRVSYIGEAAVVASALVALVACAIAWFFGHGYLLYYGDAQSHLNLSRSILDSRTPGYDQLGTVWLPMLHVICLPFVANDVLWSNGLAGSVPVGICFVIAGVFFYLAAREAYGSRSTAGVVLACFALNPNMLYLASIPMTEVVFFAGLAVLLFALFCFRRTQNRLLIVLGVTASWSMSLTRYDGWFLIPFTGLFFAAFAKRSRFILLIAISAAASLAPLYWMAHNWWETGNALDFYSGPYSAVAIQAGQPYPGLHDWLLAAGYYAKAGQLCAGWALIVLGVLGIFFAFKIKTFAPILFLLLTPAFYIWSMHSSGATPIFVPQLYPNGYYNTRYGIAVVVLAAFGVGAIVLAMPVRWRSYAVALPILSTMPWLLTPSSENWICWKESQVNSVSRRAWTQAGADFLRDNYRPGQGIMTPSASDDISGIFSRARIPLRETINVGNGPIWFANTLRPDLLRQAFWAVAQPGDAVARTVAKAPQLYTEVKRIEAPKAPPLSIYLRK